MKPLNCPKHPNGLIEHSYDLTQTVLNGIPSGNGIQSNHKYLCHDCGLELELLSQFCESTQAEERLAKDFERALGVLINTSNPP